MLLVVLGTMVLTSGCKNLFPSKSSVVNSRWKQYQEVETAFSRIVVNESSTNELVRLGFHPSVSPNVRVLSYVDLIPIFMPNQAVRKEDLPPPVRECIDDREKGMAYVVDLQVLQSKRYGNLFLDIFGFKKKTHEQGWQFKGIILIKNGTVVYKLSSGQPEISRNEKTVKPLGPLQELDSVFFGVVGKVK